MLQLIQGLLAWLRGGSLKLLTIAGIILVVWGTFSPIGTLVWWLSQPLESLGLKKNPSKELPPSSPNPVAKSKQIDCYIVFLTGVGDFSANQLTPGEEYFLNQLVKAHPNCIAVKDVFPYSAANEGLGGERLLAPLWRFADNAEGWLSVAEVLIKIRNLWRFAISTDDRYGQVYNLGIANAIVERMNAAHPIASSSRQPVKIVLIGTSGGVQVALGAVPYLDDWLNSQITVVSIGGVFGGMDGFNQAESVYHLRGTQDWVEDIGGIVFPSRWLWNVTTPFYQARQQGRYQAKISGSHAHDGPEGYFGLNRTTNGVTYVQLTVQQVNQLPIWLKRKPQNKQL